MHPSICQVARAGSAAMTEPEVSDIPKRISGPLEYVRRDDVLDRCRGFEVDLLKFNVTCAIKDLMSFNESLHSPRGQWVVMDFLSLDLLESL